MADNPDYLPEDKAGNFMNFVKDQVEEAQVQMIIELSADIVNLKQDIEAINHKDKLSRAEEDLRTGKEAQVEILTEKIREIFFRLSDKNKERVIQILQGAGILPEDIDMPPDDTEHL